MAATQVVDSAFKVHSSLGPGLLESVYETCLVHELKRRGLPTQRQLTIPVTYDDLRLDAGLRLDLLVDDCVVVELKAVENMLPVFDAQLLTYLKLSGHRLGLYQRSLLMTHRDGFPRLSGCVAHGSRCPASLRHALLAENHWKPSLWVIISEIWYNGRSLSRSLRLRSSARWPRRACSSGSPPRHRRCAGPGTGSRACPGRAARRGSPGP